MARSSGAVSNVRACRDEQMPGRLPHIQGWVSAVCGKMSVMTADRKGGDGNRTYVVGNDIVDRAAATLACRAVLDVLRHRALKVWIDAYSDHHG
jgi:hypothetical protein